MATDTKTRALVVVSRKGLFNQVIEARDIKSREDYRNLWPLVSIDRPHRLLTYVSPVFQEGNIKRRSYFSYYGNRGQRQIPIDKIVQEEEKQRRRRTGESPQHKRAKDLIQQALERRMTAGKGMPWFFSDERISDCHLEGNLLLGATRVEQETEVKLRFGDIRLDVAIYGAPIISKPILLGAIEIEYGHSFNGRKALIGKALTCPMISIDISDCTLDDLTPEWADSILTQTRSRAEEGRRKNYVYLNPLLYPIYTKVPTRLQEHKPRHQFVVFAPDKDLMFLRAQIKRVAEKLNFTDKDVNTNYVNGSKSPQAYKILVNLGGVVGSDWEEVNPDRCLMITLDRPTHHRQLPIHLMHLAIASLLACKIDGVIGYKYRDGITNNDPQNDIWISQYHQDFTRILPKRLADSTPRLLRVINDLVGT